MNYRMGVPDMAIGLLHIQFANGQRKAVTVEYENWWLPGRYPQLYGYVFLFPMIFLYHIVWPLFKRKMSVVHSRFFKQVLQKYVQI